MFVARPVAAFDPTMALVRKAEYEYVPPSPEPEDAA